MSDFPMLIKLTDGQGIDLAVVHVSSARSNC